jgi:hypothetical protein
MSESFPVSDAANESSMSAEPIDTQRAVSGRRQWIAPTLAPNSTLTVVTQSALPQPLSLLFLQSSVQCFDHNGNPAPCP